MSKINILLYSVLLVVSACGSKDQPAHKRLGPPTIGAVIPDSGVVGENIRLIGWELGKDAGVISFAGKAIEASAWSVTSVAFPVPDHAAGVVQIFVTTEGGESNAVEFSVTRSNQPPKLAGATLGDGPYNTDTDLTVSLGGNSDPDGDPLDFHYEWFVDNTSVGLNSPVLPRGVFRKGQRVRCSVTPFDSFAEGEAVSTEEIHIANARPVISSIAVSSPTFDATVPLSVLLTTADSDGDLLTASYAWYLNDSLVPGVYGSVLYGVAYRRGDRVSVRVSVSDGEVTTTKDSSSVIISNAPPAVAPPTFNSALPSKATGISASAEAFDADGDALTLTYDWDVSGSAVVNTGSVLDPSSYIKGDTVSVIVNVSDGFGGAVTAHSPVVIVQNAAPGLAGGSIIDMRYGTDDAITVAPVGAYDPDGDLIEYRYQWYLNGAPVFGATAATLPGGAAIRGNGVFAQLLADDGQLTSLPVHSNTVTVANTAPTITSATLENGPFYTESVVSARAQGWGDADGDMEHYSYQWFVNGAIVPAETSHDLAGTFFSRGDTVTATVLPFDGYDLGAALTAEPVTIRNSPPTLAWVSLGAGPFSAAASVIASLGPMVDADGDIVSPRYVWYVNGVSVATTETSILESVFFASGDTVSVRVHPFDGLNEGPGTWSNTATITASPSAPDVEILPIGPTATSGIWVGFIEPSTDPDGDPVSYSYRWKKNGELQSFAAETTLITSDLYSNRDEWLVVVTPNDGYSNGATAFATAYILFDGADNISAGHSHACLVTSSGGVKCWGDNSYGQLGNDQLGGYAASPTGVVGLESGVKLVAAGKQHTCALKLSGALACWGSNGGGQIGNGYQGGYATTPSTVTGLGETVVGVVGGYGHSCALTTSGQAKCWGSNSYGQLGNGTFGGTSLVPAAVTGLDGVTVEGLAAGELHTCLRTNQGGVKCWGLDGDGQLGDDTSLTNKAVPTDVYGLTSGTLSIAAGGRASCAITMTATKCWGKADGSYARVPQDVYGLDFDIAKVALAPYTGLDHNCAMKTDGGVLCWGDDRFAQAGYYEIEATVLVPTEIESIKSAVELAAGAYFSCAIVSSGRVRCWGLNWKGQSGNGVGAGYMPTPQLIDTGFLETVDVETSRVHSCGLSSSGGVACWGQTFFTTAKTNALYGLNPVNVESLPITIGIALSTSHSCALTISNEVWCWGANSNGQLGNGGTTRSRTPTLVEGLTRSPVDISAFGGTSCAILDDGSVECWGQNGGGIIGPVGSYSTVPYPRSGLTAPVEQITIGDSHACALLSGSVYCWGSNYTSTPEVIPGLETGVTAIASGTHHNCALTADGLLKCWGANNYGELGVPSSGFYSTPVTVSSLPGIVKSFSLGEFYTCASLEASDVYCWGWNEYGQLGIGSVGGSYSSPMTVDVGAAISKVSISGGSSLAIGASGEVYGWGKNWDSQLARPASFTWPPAHVTGF